MYPYNFIKPRRPIDLKNLSNVYLPDREEADNLWSSFMREKTQYERRLQNRIKQSEDVIVKKVQKSLLNTDYTIYPQQMICYQYKLDIPRKITRFIQPDILLINNDKTRCVIIEIKESAHFNDDVQRENTIALIRRLYPSADVKHIYMYSSEFPNLSETQIIKMMS